MIRWAKAATLPALLMLASSGSVLAQEKTGETAFLEGKTIVGAWLFWLDSSPNSKIVVIYHADGTLLHLAGGTTADGSYQNPAGGVWRKDGGRRYIGTGIYTNYAPGTSTMLYTVKASAKWTLSQDGNHFSGPFLVQVTLPDGTVIGTSTGTASATRIDAEPIP